MNYAGSVQRHLGQFLPRRAAGAAILLPLLLAAALLLLLTVGSAGAQVTVDYDTDDNTLIEIDSVAKLEAIRYDLNGDGAVAAGDATNYAMGFPTPLGTQCDDSQTGAVETCTGYELTADITLTANWTPFGPYTAILDGGGHSISGLTVSNNDANAAFMVNLSGSGILRDLGFMSPSITSTSTSARSNGVAVGQVESTANVRNVYVSGGTITTGTGGSNIGGVVGRLLGTITASWSTAAVSTTGTQTNLNVGGLVGVRDGGTISTSYAAGAVSTAAAVSNEGGLVGRSQGSGGAITNSYCSAASGLTNCIGSQAGATVASTRYTAAQMQAPTDYLGIYAHWNIDLDGNSFIDYPWNFGTSSQYPTLRTPDERATSPTTQAVGDFDWDDDTLIEIRSQAQLAVITHDLDGTGTQSTGVSNANWNLYTADTAYPSPFGTQCDDGGTGATETCTGYELAGDLTLSGNFTPIGSYTATLEGNGHSITSLTVNLSTTSNAGLFTGLGAASVVRNLELAAPSITSTATAANNHGAVAGFMAATAVLSAVSVTGGTVTVAAASANAGGLVGLARGTIRASYSTAAVAVSGNPNSVDLGGMVGDLEGGTIIASYAAGAITEGTGTGVNHGGLAGRARDFTTPNPDVSPIVTNSYCDSTVESSGSGITGVDCHATTALQSPTDYSGIYLNWNIDLETDGDLDYPWNFRTSSDYPILHTPTERAALTPAATDYDTDNDGLIEISTLAQLNAVRWDLDGNGAVLAANYSAYGTAFGGRRHTVSATEGRMGCPLATPTAGCVGYELAADLDFDSDGSGTVDSSDAFGGNFTPLGNLTATFNGRGHILSNLTIDSTWQRAGLFTELSSTGRIRYLGLVNPDISAGGANAAEVGGMAGRNAGIISASFVRGGTVNAKGDPGTSGTTGARLGGLTGVTGFGGSVVASYATASVTSTGTNVFGGGLVGSLDADTSSTATIRASWAAAPAISAGSGFTNYLGGLIGRARQSGVSLTGDSYCDTTVRGGGCIGGSFSLGGTSVSAPGHPTTDLQTPTAYDGIYSAWDVDVDGVSGNDMPWDFGSSSHYPLLKADKDGDGTATCAEFSGQTCYIPPPPPDPTPDPTPSQSVARGGGQPYNPAHDHPEIYANPRHEMTASCALKTTGEGDEAKTTSTLTFDLGSYTRPITLALSLWDGTHFRSLQSQNIPMPALQKAGQTATVEVVTDPTQTRFRIDSQYGLNLVLGYADCRTDDPE